MGEGRPTVVIKVGGSLLGWPLLPRRLEDYLAGRAEGRPVLVVGGGPAADWVRLLDRDHNLGPARSHALALRALDLTAHVLAGVVPGLEVLDDPGALAACWSSGRIPVLAPRRFLDADDREAPDPLPHTWDVTTDAIAARLAVFLGAPELVLLKSAPIPPGTDRAEAARLGLVDPAFVAASRRLARVTYVNLRDTGRPGNNRIQ